MCEGTTQQNVFLNQFCHLGKRRRRFQKNVHHKRRMGIDKGFAINRFTELDAFQLPKIDQLVEDETKAKYLAYFPVSFVYSMES